MNKTKTTMKKLLSALLALAVVLAGCSSSNSPERYIDLGMKYLSEGNYEEAVLAFTSALEIDPRSAAALEGRGDAHAAQGNYAAAAADYAQAAENAAADPEQPAAAAAEKLAAANTVLLQEVLTETGELAQVKSTIESLEAAAEQGADAGALEALIAACDRAHTLNPNGGYDARALAHSEALYRLDAFTSPLDYILLASRYFAAGRNAEAGQMLSEGAEIFGEGPFRRALRQVILTDETADADTAAALSAIYALFAAGDTDGVWQTVMYGWLTEDRPFRCYTVGRENGVMKCSFSVTDGATDGQFWFLSGDELQFVQVWSGGSFVSSRAVYTDGGFNGPFSSKTILSENSQVFTVSGTFVNGLCDGRIESSWPNHTDAGMMSMGHTLEAQRDDVDGCIFAYGPNGGYTYLLGADASCLFDSSYFYLCSFPSW